jgi:hypothetical protein
MTASGDFDAFVKDQQPSAAEAEPIDWAKERDKWLRDLAALYEQIEIFLKKYIEGGTIKISYDNITLNETDIGSYTVRRMTIKIGRQEIRLVPIGTMLIGTRGRVDVEGPAGRTRFMLVNSEASRPQLSVTVRIGGKPAAQMTKEPPKEIKWAWKIVTSPPTIQYIDLTQESVFTALMEVANG